MYNGPNGMQLPPNGRTYSEDQAQLWINNHSPVRVQPPMAMWLNENNGQFQMNVANKEEQLALWVNNNEVLRQQMCVASNEIQRQMCIVNNEERVALWANKNPGPPQTWVNGEVPPFWVNNNEVLSDMCLPNDEENPKMWVNNGVEQPIRNVIIGPQPKTVKYLTQTEIKVEERLEPIGGSVADYLLFLFESGNYHDTLFDLVELQMTVPAHSFLLIARSELFRKIFLENQNYPCVIPVDGTTYENFMLFLKCFYSDAVEFDPSVSLDILCLAFKFDVKSLISRCSSAVRGNICVTSVLSIYNIAWECNQSDLKCWCMEFITENASEVLKDKNFEMLPLEKVMAIVTQDGLNAREIEIFQAALRWADSDLRRRKMPISIPGRRKLMGPLIPFIRFLLMTGKELWDIVRPEQLLDANRFMEIYVYVNETDKGAINQVAPLGYETTPRGSKHVALMYDSPCNREPSAYMSSTAEKHVFREEFRDTMMYLCGLCFYGPGLQDHVKLKKMYVNYDVTFRIMGKNRQQNFFTSFDFKKSVDVDFEVRLPSFYPIQKDCQYTAVVEVSGYRARFGTKRALQREMKLSGGRFAVVKFFDREDVSVFSHVGICRGLVFTLSSS